MKRIALFFDRTYVDAHFCFTELARHLAKNEFQVDLFHLSNPYNLAPNFFEPNISVRQFPQGKLEKLVFTYRRWFTDELKYDAIIGTPIHGAVLGCRLAKEQGVPFFYLADEIFDPLTRYHKLENWGKAKSLDKKANQSALASIVLGEDRFTYQKKVNSLSDSHRHFLIPNSPSGEVKKLQSHYFRDVFEIRDEKPIVLFIGTLNWNLARTIYEETREYKDKDYHLVFHGRTQGLMAQNKPHPFIKVSKEPLPSSLLNYAISSADLGLVLYDQSIPQESNNGWTGGKIGTYFKNGLPVIAGNLDSFRQFETNGVGAFWDGKTELDLMIKSTLAKTDFLQKNIPAFYNLHYRYEKFFAPFLTFLLNSVS